MNENWFKENWRPLAAYTYILICLYDFIIGPTANIFLENYFHINYTEWVPLTLQGGAFFHLSFGAILGAGAYTKGLAEIEHIRNQPDYSNMYGGMGMNGMEGFNQFNSNMSQEPPLNTPVPPSSVLEAPHRGIPKG